MGQKNAHVLFVCILTQCTHKLANAQTNAHNNIQYACTLTHTQCSHVSLYVQGTQIILVHKLKFSGPQIKLLYADQRVWPISFGTINKCQHLKGHLNETVI